jgi:hypothetical protein
MVLGMANDVKEVHVLRNEEGNAVNVVLASMCILVMLVQF